MALPSAVVEQSTSKVLSVISTKLDDKASRGDIIGRIEIAVRRIDFIIEKTGKIAITYVSLLRSWNALKLKYMEGMDLLHKNKQPRRQELVDGEVVVRSSSYFHRFAKRAANLSISSLVGLVDEHLSSSKAQEFERYADWAEKSFLAAVESSRPLRHDTFRYPFVRHLFEGKIIKMIERRKQMYKFFCIWPSILEGRGVEALLAYKYFDPERLDKSFFTWLMLRISECTDIVGAAINCLRSSASLLNPVSQDAAGELILLHNFKDIADSYEPPSDEIQELYHGWTKLFRSDALCCQAANGQEPSANSIISSELSQIFPEQTILFYFQCTVPLLECRLGSASDEARSNAKVGRRGGPQPLLITYGFAPHLLSPCMLEANCTIKMQDINKEGCGHERIPSNSNNIEKNIDIARETLIDRFTDKPDEATRWVIEWKTKHGAVSMMAEKPGEDIASAAKASRRYKTRSAKKRKM